MNAMSKLRGTTMVSNAFDGRRRLRNWRNTHFGGMQAVKSHPLAMCRFRPDEGGTVNTRLNVKLAPVSGYMRSNAYVDLYQIFVPYQAIEKMWLDTQDDAGVTEMTKRRLMEGNFCPLGGESQISKACNIHPRSIGGSKRVSASHHHAYNAAVNHLRRAAYYDAEQLPKTNYVIQPAILSANVLARFNGVLDPERQIDGAINLTGTLPLKGIGRKSANTVTPLANINSYEPIVPTDGTASNGTETELENYPNAYEVNADDWSNDLVIRVSDNGIPQLFVDMEGTSEVTLRDMMKSQVIDGMIRGFAKILKDNPTHGEEIIERALYGLTVDFDDECQVLYHKTHTLSPMHQRPTDGASINDVSAHFELNTAFSTFVPRSELGGQLITIAMIKPVETLEAQPDPAQTEGWKLVNRVHDETQLDEVLLTRADLESDVAVADEDQPAFWVGHNALEHNYVTRGANAQQVAGVEVKSSMWTYEIPSSVTPENVSYPAAGIDMYPFFNWSGAHAEYTIDQVATISTSLAKGPNPVEKIQLFADDPTLVDADA